jgi:phage baseplate assembly protein W
MRDVTTIRTLDWQLKLDTFGDVVENLEDIQQCIRIILTTPKGTDPLRPEFAMHFLSYVDRPMTEAIPQVISEALEALRIWEPRIVVQSITATEVELGRLQVRLIWTLKTGSVSFTSEVLL